MAGPGDEIAAGGQDYGRLRASRADREQVIDVLKAAFTQGRLDQDELDVRVSRALASWTYADLAVLTADIPIQPAGARLPETARVSAGKKAVAAMTGATAAFAAICVVAAHTPDGSPFVLPVVAIFFVLFMTVPTGWLVLLHYWMEKRAARRLQASEMAGGGDAGDMKIVKGGDGAGRNAVSHQAGGKPAVT
jgi:Domain of unknown function (DUF1707)